MKHETNVPVRARPVNLDRGGLTHVSEIVPVVMQGIFNQLGITEEEFNRLAGRERETEAQQELPLAS